MSDPPRKKPDRDVRRRSGRLRPECGPRRGYSLIETMLVMVILGILTSIAMPQFSRSLEQARAEVAAANLRAIWTAERIYWLENRQFTSDLTTFVDRADTPQYHGLLESSIAHGGANAAYAFHVPAASASTFTATATRAPGSSWSGTFTITQDGTFTDDSKLVNPEDREIVLCVQ